jgi:hypothetical protein
MDLTHAALAPPLALASPQPILAASLLKQGADGMEYDSNGNEEGTQSKSEDVLTTGGAWREVDAVVGGLRYGEVTGLSGTRDGAVS